MKVMTYVVDKYNVISEIRGGWDDFVQENGVPELIAENMVGQSFWDFIVGDQLRELYQSLHNKVASSGNPISFNYRCDSPYEKRLLNLKIELGPCDSVCYTSELLSTEPAVLVGVRRGNFLSMQAKTNLVRCSICNRFNVECKWIEGTDLVTKYGLLSESSYINMVHVLCANCRCTTMKLVERPVTI